MVVHRMHPNLRGIHRSITKSGGTCVFVVGSIGPAEEKIFSDRYLIDSSELSSSEVASFLKEKKITMLVQRDFRGSLKLFWEEAGRTNIPRLLYDQYPQRFSPLEVLFRPRRTASLVLNLIKKRDLGSHTRITPVGAWSERFSLLLDNAHLLHFPIERAGGSSIPRNNELPLVVCIAKHGESRKRVRWLVRALRSRKSEFRLTFVGASPLSPKMARFHEATLRKIRRVPDWNRRVRVLEDLDECAVSSVLAEADLFVLPSKSEQFAISPLEALAQGVPTLIGSDSGSATYVRLVSRELVFRSFSYQDFLGKLYNLIGDSNLRSKLRDQALQSVSRNHDPQKFLAQMYKFQTNQDF